MLGNEASGDKSEATNSEESEHVSEEKYVWVGGPVLPLFTAQETEQFPPKFQLPAFNSSTSLNVANVAQAERRCTALSVCRQLPALASQAAEC